LRPDVSDLLTKAWAAVEMANLPPALHEVAFREAVRLLSSERSDTDHTSSRVEAAPKRRNNPSGGRRAARATTSAKKSRHMDSEVAPKVTEDEFFQKVETETGVARERLERLTHLENGSPHISVSARMLGTTEKARMVAVAQVLPVLRRYGLDEDETSTTIVRDECKRLKCLDDKNINSYLASGLEGILYTGPSTNRRLRVRPPGVRAFATIVAQVLGETPVPA
jgi:hypothetical protein